MENTIYKSEILEAIRSKILLALKSVDLKEGADYKLSQIDEQSTVFKIEVFNYERVRISLIKNILKMNFQYIPGVSDHTHFIKIRCLGEYDYLYSLLNSKINTIF